MKVPPKKLFMARLFSICGLGHLCAGGQRLFLRKGHIRAVYYHETVHRHLPRFEEHLRFYRRRYDGVSIEDFHRFFASGCWDKNRPGLIISFDDGLRSNFQTAPLLEAYGFTGWYMVPPAFVDTPPAEQAEFARSHQINLRQQYEDGRVAMSWDELRTLAQSHVVCCHTGTHMRMRADLSRQVLHREIVESKGLLEKRLGRPVDTFCWVGGEEDTYTSQAAQLIRQAGYRYAFMTNNCPITPRTHPLQLQRTYVHPTWPLDVVAFQVCGAMDLLYARKRRRVNRITA
jgi:peptidoglycan/xylan/chitin deacetylase (PgdA/CDA1 family)